MYRLDAHTIRRLVLWFVVLLVGIGVLVALPLFVFFIIPALVVVTVNTGILFSTLYDTAVIVGVLVVFLTSALIVARLMFRKPEESVST